MIDEYGCGEAIGVDGADGAKGDKGDKGDTGATGPGVAAGGTAGQVLSKIDATDYNTQWVDAGSGGVGFDALFMLGGM